MSEGELTFNRRAVRPIQCFRDGWQLIKEDYWLLLGISLLGLLLASFAPMGLLMGPMMCGIYLCYLRRDAGQRISFDMLFRGFDYFVQSLIATLTMIAPILLLVGLFYVAIFIALFAAVVPAATPAPGQPPDLTGVWIFTAVYGVGGIGMILISILYHVLFLFTYFLIVDRGLSGFEAVKLSARAGLANFGGLLALLLLTTLMGLVGALACYVGAVFEYPLTVAMTMIAYRQVFPVEGSVLFEPPPPNWPEVGGQFDSAQQTGVQPAPDRPVSVTKPPEEPGIQEQNPNHETHETHE